MTEVLTREKKAAWTAWRSAYKSGTGRKILRQAGRILLGAAPGFAFAFSDICGVSTGAWAAYGMAAASCGMMSYPVSLGIAAAFLMRLLWGLTTRWELLIGAVLVGVNFAKGLAYSANKPLVPVHHLRGHIAALYLTHPELKPPFLCLVASGGHSHIVEVQDYTHYHILGHTVDDAAGEAFDKVARTLGLPYPGGPSVANAAKTGDPKAYRLPVPHVDGKYNVSFSGLKTAVLNEVNKAQMKNEEINVPDLAASFQERIAGILAEKLLLAAADTGAKQVCLAGGVAANGRLRQLVNDGAQKLGAKVYLPELKFCGDNGAMIAAQGYYQYIAGHTAGLELNGLPTLPIDYE